MTTSFSSLRPYAVAAFAALLIALAAMACCQVWPFGGNFLAWPDNMPLAASDFGYVKQLVSGRSDLFWTYACGGVPHSSLHPTFNNLFSPLTWLIAYIPGVSILGKLSLLFLLQIMLLPLGALLYLRRTFPRLPESAGVALALSYAFSAFLFTKHGFLPFLNIAILFPFFLYGLDRLLKQSKWLFFVLVLTYALTAAPCFACTWLLFAMVYAASRQGWGWNSPVRQNNVLLLGAVLLALALSAWSWLPSIIVTSGTARLGTSLLEVASKPGIVVKALTAWLFPPLCMVVLLFVSSWKKLFSNRYMPVAIVLLAALALTPVSNFWHASAPFGFWGRYSYMLAFTLVCAAAYAWGRPKQAGWMGWICSLPFILLALAGFTMLAAANLLANIPGLASLQQQTEHLAGVGGRLAGTGELIWIPAFLLTAFAFITKRRRLACVLASLSMVPALACYMAYYVNRGHLDFHADPTKVQLASWAESQLPPRDGGDFYGRVSCPGQCLPENVSFYSPFETFSHYRAQQTAGNEKTLEAWGYAHAPSAHMYSEGGTIFSDTLMGTRYYALWSDAYDGFLPLVARDGNFRLHENPWYFGAGLMLPEGIDLEPEKGMTPPEYQRKAIAAILGSDDDCLVVTHSFPGTIEPARWLYAYPAKSLGFRPTRITYSNTVDYVSRPELQQMPSGLALRIGTMPQPFTTFELSENALASLKEYAKELPVSVSYHRRDMDIETTSTAERSLLFLPLLWQEGYTASEGDRALDVRQTGGFVSVLLPEPGRHQVRLTWHRPFATAAWCLTGAGLAILLFSLWRWRSPEWHEGAANLLCRRALVIAAAATFAIPLLLCAARLVGLLRF